MGRMKKYCALFLVLFLATVMSGCSINSPKDEQTQKVAKEAAPITFTDHLGRTVTLEKPAERVIGTHNPSMNMVVVIDGNGGRIAGFGMKDKAFGLYEQVAPEINKVTQVGKAKDYNMETVLSVNPDLVILPKKMQALVKQFEEAGLPVIVLDVEKYDSIIDALTLVGKAIGQDEKAAAITSYLEDKIAKFSKIAADAKTKPSVLFIGSSSQYNVSVDAMLQNLMIETAGGKNVTAGLQGDFWTEVDIEQIVKWNPEVIYVPAYASYKAEDIMKNAKWANINAVKNGKVYTFPSTLEPWDYPVAASILGLVWTCHNLHPDLYTYEDMMADVDEFYQLVYGKTFTAQELGIAE